MLLAVDIGNTNILCGGIENGKIIHSFRMTTQKKHSAAEYAVELNDLIRLYFKNAAGTPEKPDGAIISSVVPGVTHSIEKAIIETLFLMPVIVKREIQPPFPILLDAPASLGSDRICDATAVLKEYPLPAIIFDLGTATTCSVLTEKGEFIGGLISPGIKTSSDALLSNASLLGSYELGNPKQLIGSNTEDSINSGIVYGHASMVDGLIRRIESHRGCKHNIILTGGLSGLIAQYCECDVIVDKFLILKGLNYLYQMRDKCDVNKLP